MGTWFTNGVKPSNDYFPVMLLNWTHSRKKRATFLASSADFRTSKIQVACLRVCHSRPDFHRDKLQQSLPRTWCGESRVSILGPWIPVFTPARWSASPHKQGDDTLSAGIRASAKFLIWTRVISCSTGFPFSITGTNGNHSYLWIDFPESSDWILYAHFASYLYRRIGLQIQSFSS